MDPTELASCQLPGSKDFQGQRAKLLARFSNQYLKGTNLRALAHHELFMGFIKKHFYKLTELGRT